MLLNLFDKFVFEVFKQMFHCIGLFFRAGDVFFQFQSFNQICKILVQSMSHLVVFDYSMVRMENDSVCGFPFMRKEEFEDRPKFLSVHNIFAVQVLKVLFFVCFKVFAHLLLCFFVILPVYTCARFIKLITQFRPYHFFRRVFCHERMVAISDLFFAYREQMRLELTEISQ